MILGLNILNCLSVVSKNVNSYDSMVEVWVRRLQNLVVCMFLVVESIQSLKQKFKYSAQVFRGRCRHKNVAEAIDNS